MPPALFDSSSADGRSSRWRAAQARLLSLKPPGQGDEADCTLNPRDYCETRDTGRIILIRHGESTWNEANLFTGWHDVPLSANGERQAAETARALQAANVCFDAVYTSTLKRTIKTAWILLESLDAFALPVTQAWQLNERMYGALTGLNKAETREFLGEEAFEELRRVPPPVSCGSCYDPSSMSRYDHVPEASRPTCESFEDTRDRVLPFWHEEILPRAARGESVCVISSKNALRALLMGVAGDYVDAEQLVDLDIPNGMPLVFEPTSGTLTKLSSSRSSAAAGSEPDGELDASVWEALARGPPREQSDLAGEEEDEVDELASRRPP